MRIRHQRRRSGIWAIFCLAMFAPHITEAATTISSEASSTKTPTTDAVLRAGLEPGKSERQEQQLTAILEKHPNDKLARAYQGFLPYGRSWVHVERLAELQPLQGRLELYESARQRAADDVAGNLDMANWCRAKNMSTQERAHLLRVVQLQPNHSVARQRLGYQARNGSWVETRSMWQNAVDGKQQLAAMHRWVPRLQRLRRQLGDRNASAVGKAKQQLLKIEDVQAIPAIEYVLLTGTANYGGLALSAIDRMPEHQASLALARQAVLTPHNRLRRQAIQLLRQRPASDYQDGLLDTLREPIQATTKLDLVGGRLRYRHVFTQLTRDRRDVAVNDTVYAARPDTEDSVEALRAAAINNIEARQRVRDNLQANNNAVVQTLNRRVVYVLAQTTGRSDLTTPSDWWDWSDSENGISRRFRETSSRYGASRQIIGEPSRRAAESLARAGFRPNHECFAAGTPVWTARGMKPIEDVRVGDLVLSQDVGSGQLALQPVITTTVRPPEPLVRLKISGDTITSTAGHPYWVPQQGWTLAGKLTENAEVYSLGPECAVQARASAPAAQTYNLIVDNFHTYFVGSSRVLTHDNTRPRPTSALVPGVSRSREAAGGKRSASDHGHSAPVEWP